jgi:hypothetical protein
VFPSKEREVVDMSTLTAVRQDELSVLEREADQFGGLCAMCLNANRCTFPRTPGRAILSCDEFEAPETLPTRSFTFAIPTPELEELDTTELKGLCRHCAIRITCRYPKPPGGVWHCDELA